MKSSANNRLPPADDPTPAHGLDAVAPNDELLVAYLDGELDREGIADVESKLGSDAQLRKRLDQLRSAWDLLEELPPVKPNPNFAQSTIEMVSMSAAEMAPAAEVRRHSRRWWLGLLLVLPTMLVLGYVGTRAWLRFQERSAIEQLHALADWDALEAVGSVQWLEKLKQVDDLTSVTKRNTNSGLGVGLVPATVAERRKWIMELSPTDRDRLSANLEKFKQSKRTRPAGQRNSVIDLADHIYASPDPEANLQLARSYENFLREYMSVSDRARHLDQPDMDKRLEDLVKRVNNKMIDVYAHELTVDSPDRQAYEAWKAEMRDQYSGSLPGDNVEFDLMRRLALRDSVIEEENLDGLLASLSPRAQELIGRLETKELQHAALIMMLVDPRQSRRPIDRAQAVEQFERMDESRQASIEFLPPEQAQSRVGLGAQGDPGRRRPGNFPGGFRGNNPPGGGR